MNAGWKRLIERKNWPGEGWLKSVEVTRGQDGSAHPHFHVMVMVKPSYFSHGYIKQEEWAEQWKSVMRLDYMPVVDVRAVKPKKEGQTIEAAVVETLKYATKVQDSLKSPEWLYIVTEQLHKMRFVESGGVLKGVLKENSLTKSSFAMSPLIVKTILKKAEKTFFSDLERIFKKVRRSTKSIPFLHKTVLLNCFESCKKSFVFRCDVR